MSNSGYAAAVISKLLEKYKIDQGLDQYGRPLVILRTNNKFLVLDARTELPSYLQKLAKDEHMRIPNIRVLKENLEGLLAEIQFGDDRLVVYSRVAGDAEQIYIDLQTGEKPFVRIHKDGWELTAECPFYFRRSPSSLPLPIPEEGGTLKCLSELMNLGTKERLIIAIGWLISSSVPSGPYSILCLQGEKGSAKSTVAKQLRAIIDPNTGEASSLPKGEIDFAVKAINSWIFNIDNLSGLKPEMADAFCKLATGVSFSKRALYTDTQEINIQVCRPVSINGIDGLQSRDDLADRMILLTLDRLPDESRKTENELSKLFREKHPKLLGSLCDCLSKVLALNECHFPHSLPRMADSAKRAANGVTALGYTQIEYLDALRANLKEIKTLAAEANTLLLLMVEFLDGHPKRGAIFSSEQWLGKLKEFAAQKDKFYLLGYWSRSPQCLSNEFLRSKEIALNFSLDIEKLPRRGNQRPWSVKLIPSPPSLASLPCSNGDDDDDSDNTSPTFDDVNDPKDLETQKGWEAANGRS